MGNTNSTTETYAKKESYKSLTTCIKNDSENPILYIARAEILLERRKYEKAIEDLSRAITLDPTFLKAYEERALCYHMLGDFDAAICDPSKRIELDPANANAYNNRGAVFRSKGDYISAIVDLTKAIALKPEDPYSYRNRAAAYCGKGNLKKAKIDLLKAIELDPKGDPVDYSILGDISLHEQDLNAALQYYTLATELDPSNKELEEKLGDLIEAVDDDSSDHGLDGIDEVDSEGEDKMQDTNRDGDDGDDDVQDENEAVDKENQVGLDSGAEKLSDHNHHAKHHHHHHHKIPEVDPTKAAQEYKHLLPENMYNQKNTVSGEKGDSDSD